MHSYQIKTLATISLHCWQEIDLNFYSKLQIFSSCFCSLYFDVQILACWRYQDPTCVCCMSSLLWGASNNACNENRMSHHLQCRLFFPLRKSLWHLVWKLQVEVHTHLCHRCMMFLQTCWDVSRWPIHHTSHPIWTSYQDWFSRIIQSQELIEQTG